MTKNKDSFENYSPLIIATEDHPSYHNAFHVFIQKFNQTANCSPLLGVLIWKILLCGLESNSQQYSQCRRTFCLGRSFCNQEPPNKQPPPPLFSQTLVFDNYEIRTGT